MPLFNTHIMVDWSASSEPTPKRCSKDSIWWAVARDGVVEPPKYCRTRHNAIKRLADLIATEIKANRRVLIGFDFAFGYPAGVAEHLTGKTCGIALWDWLADHIKDDKDNDNNRYAVAAKINRKYPGVGPFWGRPRSRKYHYPDVPIGGLERTRREAHPREWRITDCRAKGVSSVWKLYYPGSVGSQVLLGLPAVKRLITDPRIKGHAKVWPLQTGLCTPDSPVVVTEIYPSLLREEVNKRMDEGKIRDAVQVSVNAEAYARLDAQGGLVPLFTDDALDLTPSQRHIVETEEAWILGVGHEDALRNALKSF